MSNPESNNQQKISIELPELPLPVMSLDQVSRLLMVVGTRERMLMEALASAKMHLAFGWTDRQAVIVQRDAKRREMMGLLTEIRNLFSQLKEGKIDTQEVMDSLLAILTEYEEHNE